MKISSTKIIKSILESNLSTLENLAWNPRADIYSCEEGWLVKIELAGIRMEDIKLTIEQNRLVVEGTRRDMIIKEVQKSYSMEISYNQFQRTIELPSSLEEAKIITKYQDGMLIIRLKKGSE
jgi:HSP20 family protein